MHTNLQAWDEKQWIKPSVRDYNRGTNNTRPAHWRRKEPKSWKERCWEVQGKLLDAQST